jgi:hypothetical protein
MWRIFAGPRENRCLIGGAAAGATLSFSRAPLAEKLGTVTDWPWMATEWTIDQDLAVKVAENATLSLRGRIDLLLARKAPSAGFARR